MRYTASAVISTHNWNIQYLQNFAITAESSKVSYLKCMTDFGLELDYSTRHLILVLTSLLGTHFGLYQEKVLMIDPQPYTRNIMKV